MIVLLEFTAMTALLEYFKIQVAEKWPSQCQTMGSGPAIELDFHSLLTYCFLRCLCSVACIYTEVYKENH